MTEEEIRYRSLVLRIRAMRWAQWIGAALVGLLISWLAIGLTLWWRGAS